MEFLGQIADAITLPGWATAAVGLIALGAGRFLAGYHSTMKTNAALIAQLVPMCETCGKAEAVCKCPERNGSTSDSVRLVANATLVGVQDVQKRVGHLETDVRTLRSDVDGLKRGTVTDAARKVAAELGMASDVLPVAEQSQRKEQ